MNNRPKQGYKLATNLDPYVCIYCGLTASTVDHIPSIAAVRAIGRDMFDELIKVPSCGECNSTLGDKWLHTVQDRKDFLFNTYTKKYRAAIAAPSWTEEELSNIGPNLRASIETQELFKQCTLKRLERLCEPT